MVDKLNAHAVYTTDDESGRPRGLVGIYTSKAAADVAKSKQGWYGGDGVVKPMTLVLVGDRYYPVMAAYEDGFSADHFDINLIDAARQSKDAARLKLQSLMSVEELALLGIKV